MPVAMKNMIVLAVIFLASLVEAAPYSKYGRSCKDIGCPSNEICIMAEDPCTHSNSACGRYPTCKKMNQGEQTCSSLICQRGQYCKTENGRAVCVNSSPNLGHDSAVNNQETNTYDHGSHTNSNPYDNANAPPAEDVFGSPAKPYHPVGSNSETNLGYPPYPSNSGNSNPSGNNNGYPPYSTNHGNNQPPARNDGYPPYPTNNRMPLPGQSGYPYGQPGYYQPGQLPPNGQRYPAQNPGYPNYASPNYPNQNYPQSNSKSYNPGYRRNSGTSLTSSSMMMITTICFAFFTFLKTGLLS